MESITSLPKETDILTELKKYLIKSSDLLFGKVIFLEKEMTTHPSILAWRFPWTEEPGSLQSMGSQGSDTTEQLNTTEQ